MVWDSIDRREFAMMLVAVLAVTVVASAGFWSLSENPLVPDAEFEVSDAPENYDLSRGGTVPMVSIEHTGGERIELSNLSVRLGTTNGIEYRPSTNWTNSSGNLVWSLLLNGQRVTGGETFSRGDELTVAKTSGREEFNGSIELRVRLYHFPSQRTILDRTVVVR